MPWGWWPSDAMAPEGTAPHGARLPMVDVARTFALANMAAFHFFRDLDTLLPAEARVAPWGFSFGPAWQAWAMGIAGGFLFLAGFSLWLGHGRRLRRSAYLRRLGVLVLAAAGVTLATYLTFPDQWVRFGILHSIAAASMIGLAFLRLPWGVTAIAGLAAIAAGVAARSPCCEVAVLSGPTWVWLGLSPDVPYMMDWEPLLPWVGPFLLGLAAGRLADGRGWLAALSGRPAGAFWRRLGWPGRHSLTIYLIHQPVLVGLVLAWGFLA